VIQRVTDGYELRVEVWLPQPPEQIFPFFADARNLQQLTPPWLSFEVLTPDPIVMREGALIDYKLRVRGIPLRWRTLIEAWQPPHRFVDRQVRGPYRLWHHEHAFEEHEGGTIARDRVLFRSPGGPLVHTLFVNRDVARIFRYRQQQLRQLFDSSTLPRRTTAHVAG
jgi:ligand-binding SRPBCC domain-containing protein